MTNENSKNLPAEKTFFAVQGKGRQGLTDMVTKMKDQMWETRPSFLPDAKKEMFFQKAIMNIANDEKLDCLTSSREGLYQIFLQLQKGVQLGMVPGGVRPQFYIVPRKKYEKNGGGFKGQYIATFIPTQDGLRYVVTTGKTAVFRDVLWGVVRNGYTTFKIDEVNGIIEHDHDPIKTAKNEIMGVWIRCTRINKTDVDIVKFVSAEKILSIRDNYSDAYKYAKSPADKAKTVWGKSEEEQYIKTAVKSVLKHYVSMSEGMSQMFEMDEAQEEREANYNAQPVSDRMGDRLDDINNNNEKEPDNVVIDSSDVIPADIIADVQTGDTPKKKTTKPTKKEPDNEPTKGDLF